MTQVSSCITLEYLLNFGYLLVERKIISLAVWIFCCHCNKLPQTLWLKATYQKTVAVWVCVWVFYSSLLVFLSVFVPVPCCFYYYGSVVYLFILQYQDLNSESNTSKAGVLPLEPLHQPWPLILNLLCVEQLKWLARLGLPGICSSSVAFAWSSDAYIVLVSIYSWIHTHTYTHTHTPLAKQTSPSKRQFTPFSFVLTYCLLHLHVLFLIIKPYK
jgi:hypothetical protein